MFDRYYGSLIRWASTSHVDDIQYKMLYDLNQETLAPNQMSLALRQKYSAPVQKSLEQAHHASHKFRDQRFHP
eukprot:271044-Pyramimonas_sp.AAC.1